MSEVQKVQRVQWVQRVLFIMEQDLLHLLNLVNPPEPRYSSTNLHHQHGVSVAVKPVVRGDGVAVCGEYVLTPCEGRDEHQQR